MTAYERKKVYIEYMQAKIVEEDWHAVSDIACDLREIEVELGMVDITPKALPVINGGNK